LHLSPISFGIKSARMGSPESLLLCTASICQFSMNIMDSSVKQSCDFPDGTYFANFSQFPNCQLQVAKFHNGITAGYFYQFAISAAGQSFKSATFDPKSFALGYGSHMISDQVGFYPVKGYLGTVPNYVTFFPFMTAIDALVSTLGTFPPGEEWGSLESSGFLAAATKYYNNINPSFEPFNTSFVADCALPWAQTDAQLVELANLQASTGYYQPALVFYDKFNATSFEQAVDHFKLANGCAVQAVQFWGNQMQNNIDPTLAYSNTLSEIAGYFNANHCYPVVVNQ